MDWANRRLNLIVGLLLLILCMSAGGMAWIVYELPVWAEQKFGTPDNNLDWTKRMEFSLRLLFSEDLLIRPVNVNAQSQVFEIGLGEPVQSIGARLQNAGLLRDADSFEFYLIYTGLDTGIQAGKYELSPALNAMQMAYALQDATSESVDFVVLAGWRLEEVAAALPTSGLQITPDAFMGAALNWAGKPIPNGLPPLNSLEGFLHPGIYRFKRDISLHDMLGLFLERSNEKLTPQLRESYRQQGLDVYQAVVLASLVQREAVESDEMPRIAAVFINRLATGMKLDSDPTVQYAVGYNSLQQKWWTNPLTVNDLEFDSPYNTYKMPGLPPTPICNPGILALNAVANPDQAGGPFYFFRASCDGLGRHEFSVTYEEHLQKVCP